MSAIAVITARGGSKRIPYKNIREFCGKPIIAYSIQAAINSRMFDEVMVSTDSEEIASIAKKYGAEVPFLRSEKTSDDYATTVDVLIEVLECYEAAGKKFEFLCCLYPTAPFVTGEKLSAAVNMIKNSKGQSLMPVVKFSYPPQRAVIIHNGRLKYQYPEFERERSQDLEPIYHDCGQFYICKTEVFKQSHSLITDDTIPFIVPEEEVQDIDTLSDWEFAEIKYRKYMLEGRGHVSSVGKDQ